jgi:hypothetical protein
LITIDTLKKLASFKPAENDKSHINNQNDAYTNLNRDNTNYDAQIFLKNTINTESGKNAYHVPIVNKESSMAVISMIFGIVGYIMYISCINQLYILGLMDQFANLLPPIVKYFIFGNSLQNQIIISLGGYILSLVLSLLAFIFGIIERKKGITYKYYSAATVGFALGFIFTLLITIYLVSSIFGLFFALFFGVFYVLLPENVLTLIISIVSIFLFIVFIIVIIKIAKKLLKISKPNSQALELLVLNDSPSLGFAVLCFFFPLIGLILFLLWFNSSPKKAYSCGKGAYAGAIVFLFMPIIILIITIIISIIYIVIFSMDIGTLLQSINDFLRSI